MGVTNRRPAIPPLAFAKSDQVGKKRQIKSNVMSAPANAKIPQAFTGVCVSILMMKNDNPSNNVGGGNDYRRNSSNRSMSTSMKNLARCQVCIHCAQNSCEPMRERNALSWLVHSNNWCIAYQVS